MPFQRRGRDLERPGLLGKVWKMEIPSGHPAWLVAPNILLTPLEHASVLFQPGC